MDEPGQGDLDGIGTGPARIVICSADGVQPPLELPESRFGGPPYITGGVRSLYEMAVGAAALGFDVELRGALNEPILRELADAAGACPRVDLAPRPPDPGEIVVMPEAIDLSLYATVALSRARGVIALLAPPGLWGWTFLSEWKPAAIDPLTVPFDSYGTPPMYRAIEALGFDMWTNAHGTAERGAEAGVTVRWIGTGTPIPFPEPVERTFDVAVVAANRWYGWARQIADELGRGVRVLEVPPRPDQYSLSADLAPARILIWPSRAEGMSRIAREARGVGTIPVALDTNPFVTAADHGGGVELAPDLAALRRTVERLLADPQRQAALADEGRVSAREQADWGAFTSRLGAAVRELWAEPLPPAAALPCLAPDSHRQLMAAVRAAQVRQTARREEELGAALAAMEARASAAEARVWLEQDRHRREVEAIRARKVLRLVDSVAGRLRHRSR